jgi:hypothetical protein
VTNQGLPSRFLWRLRFLFRVGGLVGVGLSCAHSRPDISRNPAMTGPSYEQTDSPAPADAEHASTVHSEATRQASHLANGFERLFISPFGDTVVGLSASPLRVAFVRRAGPDAGVRNLYSHGVDDSYLTLQAVMLGPCGAFASSSEFLLQVEPKRFVLLEPMQLSDVSEQFQGVESIHQADEERYIWVTTDSRLKRMQWDMRSLAGQPALCIARPRERVVALWESSLQVVFITSAYHNRQLDYRVYSADPSPGMLEITPKLLGSCPPNHGSIRGFTICGKRVLVAWSDGAVVTYDRDHLASRADGTIVAHIRNVQFLRSGRDGIIGIDRQLTRVPILPDTADR